MLAAVNFNHQPCLKANEIEDIALQRHLPPEVDAKLMGTQAAPEAAFGIRHIAAQLAGGLGQRVGHG